MLCPSRPNEAESPAGLSHYHTYGTTLNVLDQQCHFPGLPFPFGENSSPLSLTSYTCAESEHWPPSLPHPTGTERIDCTVTEYALRSHGLLWQGLAGVLFMSQAAYQGMFRRGASWLADPIQRPNLLSLANLLSIPPDIVTLSLNCHRPRGAGTLSCSTPLLVSVIWCSQTRRHTLGKCRLRDLGVCRLATRGICCLVSLGAFRPVDEIQLAMWPSPFSWRGASAAAVRSARRGNNRVPKR